MRACVPCVGRVGRVPRVGRVARVPWAACVACVACVAWAALVAAARAADVSVLRLQLEFDVDYEFVLNNTVEYTLQFTPSEEWAAVPSRVWASVDRGDPSRPVLLTYRQKTGAGTWQLPYWAGPRLQRALRRTLCPDDSAPPPGEDVCAEEGEAEAEGAGAFSLHAVSGCARAVRLRLRVEPARDWRLHLLQPLPVHVTLSAPSVHYYSFPAEAEADGNVRLVVRSDDDVCALVAVQSYSCPIAETLDDMVGGIKRMTILRSGAAHISRRKYPRGLYVVALVLPEQAQCAGEGAPPPDDWLLRAALEGEEPGEYAPPRPLNKSLFIEIQPALSRAQYWAATAATLAAFLAAYALCAALVAAQRYPPFGRTVRPRAPLAPLAAPEGREEGGPPRSEVDSRPRRRRSDATFDSSDLSDTDEEEEEDAPHAAPVTPVAPVTPASPATTTSHIPPASPTTTASPAISASSTTPASPTTPAAPTAVDSNTLNGTTADQPIVPEEQARPFGLPARLRLAALSRRRGRVLRARSDRYLYTLYTVAVFYALPVVQFVAAFQLFLNVSGSLDTCYYNFLCAHPWGGLSDFNHVLSNAGYLLLGALFALQVRRRRRNRKLRPRDEEYGIPAHYGQLEALGVGMMVVGLLSASYHVCPNRLNFQFDTAFMYVLTVLSMVKIYQSRHPDVTARAHATFGVLAVLIALVVWGVLGGGAWFWATFTVLHLFSFLLLSLQIYYLGQFRLEKQTVTAAVASLSAPPLYSARLAALLVANAANWALAIYGLYMQQSDFASHLLNVLLANTLMHMLYYLGMKLLHGERPRWYVWVYLACAGGAWAPALVYFAAGSSDWAAAAAQSRLLNHECRLLRFYDSHDLWHFLSAIALYFSFNVLLSWDDGLAAVKRTDIAVF